MDLKFETTDFMIFEVGWPVGQALFERWPLDTQYQKSFVETLPAAWLRDKRFYLIWQLDLLSFVRKMTWSSFFSLNRMTHMFRMMSARHKTSECVYCLIWGFGEMMTDRSKAWSLFVWWWPLDFESQNNDLLAWHSRMMTAWQEALEWWLNDFELCVVAYWHCFLMWHTGF